MIWPECEIDHEGEEVLNEMLQSERAGTEMVLPTQLSLPQDKVGEPKTTTATGTRKNLAKKSRIQNLATLHWDFLRQYKS